MERSNISLSERIDAWIAEFDDYRKGLRYENQERFDRLISRAKLQRVTIQNFNHDDLDTVMLLNMLIAIQREIDIVRGEQITELETRIQDLEQRAWDEADQSSVAVDSGARP